VGFPSRQSWVPPDWVVRWRGLRRAARSQCAPASGVRFPMPVGTAVAQGAGCQRACPFPTAQGHRRFGTILCALVSNNGLVPKRWRATAVQDAGAFATALSVAERPGVRQTSGAVAQGPSCQTARPFPMARARRRFRNAPLCWLAIRASFHSGIGPCRS
jgi:hypothetical protein